MFITDLSTSREEWRWRELDAEQISERIEQITPKLYQAELKSVLPEELNRSLEIEEFESLRAAVRTLFAEWS